MSLDKLSRRDMQIGVTGVVLVISLLFFPWFSISDGLFTLTVTGTGNPDGWLGVLALVAAVAVVADLGFERFTPHIRILGLAGSREATRAAFAVLAAALLALKFLLNIHFDDFGWGFYLDVIAVVGLVYGTLDARHNA